MQKTSSEDHPGPAIIEILTLQGSTRREVARQLSSHLGEHPDRTRGKLGRLARGSATRAVIHQILEAAERAGLALRLTITLEEDHKTYAVQGLIPGLH